MRQIFGKLTTELYKHLSFTKWKEVLNNDEALTTAILDRLIHHSHLINVTGESYRLKQKREAGLLDISAK